MYVTGMMWFVSRNHEELRTQFWKQLELQAAADQKAQLRLKREIAERDKLVDQHYHDLLLADIEAKKRREELETIERNRANYVQVQALIEQIAASDNSKAARAARIAQEHQYLVIIPSFSWISVALLVTFTPGTNLHRVSKKLCQLIFCSLSVKYEPISIKCPGINP